MVKISSVHSDVPHPFPLTSPPAPVMGDGVRPKISEVKGALKELAVAPTVSTALMWERSQTSFRGVARCTGVTNRFFAPVQRA
jgi:hypothetical protein